MKRERVFQIDQECFIIYAEDLSTPKERFLRIGNSKFLKQFDQRLTFLSLITPLYPGNPLAELEIFRPDIDRKIIGLKNNVVHFLRFLNVGRINLNKVKVIYAEGQGWVENKKTTEEEFLKDISSDQKRKKHAFASFYHEGNIRIFNRNEIIFDLKERLSETLDERKEIKRLSSYFNQFYQSAYLNEGMIGSGSSLFLFSNHHFCCLTSTSSWIADATRVGINPSKIELLYFTEDVTPDSLWIKVFLQISNLSNRIHLVSPQSSPAWTRLLPGEIFNLDCCRQNKVSFRLQNIELNFEQETISISCQNYKMRLPGRKNFLQPGAKIDLQVSGQEHEIKSRLIIDHQAADAYTFYLYNPLIFQHSLEHDNYIARFYQSDAIKQMKGYDEKKQSLLNEKILSKDHSYQAEYFPDQLPHDFNAALLIENIRRLNWENNEYGNQKTYREYEEALKDFRGEVINQHQLVINQLMAFDSGQNKVVFRNSLANSGLVLVDQSVNPFLFFLKDLELGALVQKYKSFKQMSQPYLTRDANQIRQMKQRFEHVIKAQLFFKKERQRLKEFMDLIEDEEKNALSGQDLLTQHFSGETGANKKDNLSQQAPNTKPGKQLENEAQIFKDLYTGEEILNELNRGERRSRRKTIRGLLLGLALLLLLLLPLLSVLTFRGEKLAKLWNYTGNNKEQKMINQEKILNQISSQYADSQIKPGITSHYYQFYMTLRDQVHITNKVARLNHYSWMLFTFEKDYMKGKNPDWIYPGNVLVFPDSQRIIVSPGDSMWSLSEKYLIQQINQHEIQIKQIIEQTKLKKLSIEQAKKKFKRIKNESDSEMVRVFLALLMIQKDFNHWEFYEE